MGCVDMRFATLYIPEFPVWAVQLFEPALAQRDLLVQLSGKVAARSERLRAAGIEKGWAIERARAQAPEALLRTHPGVRTQLAWEVALRSLNAITPWLEAGVAGDFVHRATDRETRQGVDALAPEGLAVLGFIADPISTVVARRLRARIGVAGDRATSLLAALSADHATACIVAPGEERAFLDRLPLRWLGGTGILDSTCQRLAWLGFHSVGAIARLTPAQMRAQFPDGRVLCALTRGDDRRPVSLFLPPPSVRVEHQAIMPLREPGEWEPVLRHLLRQAVGQLGERDARMVTLSLSTGHRRRMSRRLCREATSDARTLWIITRLAMLDIAASMEEGVETFTLTLEGLVRAAPRQERLWGEERTAFEKALADVEKRLPGLSLRVVGVDENAYLPEEAFQLLPIAAPSTTMSRGKFP